MGDRILKAEEARGRAGRDVSNREIYVDIGRFIDLSAENLRETQYGGRKAYENAVRSYLSDLRQKGDLVSSRRGYNRLTPKGKARIL